jgi:hypothetical protein
VGIVAQWAEEESLQLIEVYKTNAILWDPKHINDYKKNLKEDTWRDIGCAMGRSAECKNKTACWLRTGERKTKKSKGTGKGKFF